MELLAALVILGVLSSIVVLSVHSIIDNTKEEVCHINRLELTRNYPIWLLSNEKTHSETAFTTYIVEQNSEPCPENGILTYQIEQILCSIHFTDDEEPEDDGDSEDGVPYL